MTDSVHCYLCLKSASNKFAYIDFLDIYIKGSYTFNIPRNRVNSLNSELHHGGQWIIQHSHNTVPASNTASAEIEPVRLVVAGSPVVLAFFKPLTGQNEFRVMFHGCLLF